MSTGMLGAFGMGTAIKHQMNFENSVSNLDKVFGEKQSYELQRQLAFANPNEIMHVASRMLGSL
ncbi:MAG: hypothetical protein KBS61_09610 [Chryseobacterium sp.]|nr:hypothetical protein [Candidatus Chryseobacterium enterohippi]